MRALSNDAIRQTRPLLTISARSRAWLTGAAGTTIILFSAGVAMLPLADPVGGSAIVGYLLLLAGIVEMLAGALRTRAQVYPVAAGLVTSIAGITFLCYAIEHFFAMVYILIGWLVVRTMVLLLSAEHADGTAKLWFFASAVTDLLIVLLLLEGLTISTVTVGLFGPTWPMALCFAWVVALSLVVNGCTMIEIAVTESFFDAGTKK